MQETEDVGSWAAVGGGAEEKVLYTLYIYITICILFPSTHLLVLYSQDEKLGASELQGGNCTFLERPACPLRREEQVELKADASARSCSPGGHRL